MVSTPTIAPADLGLASLDQQPACQCPHQGEGCGDPAAVRVQITHLGAHECRPIVRLLCAGCLRTSIVSVMQMLLDSDAPFRCQACGETVATVRDILPSIRSL